MAALPIGMIEGAPKAFNLAWVESNLNLKISFGEVGGVGVGAGIGVGVSTVLSFLQEKAHVMYKAEHNMPMKYCFIVFDCKTKVTKFNDN
jgi:hypothetical protein